MLLNAVTMAKTNEAELLVRAESEPNCVCICIPMSGSPTCGLYFVKVFCVRCLFYTSYVYVIDICIRIFQSSLLIVY